jgi:hypothetical protein
MSVWCPKADGILSLKFAKMRFGEAGLRTPVASMHYGWSKVFREAGKRRLAGNTDRAATCGEVGTLTWVSYSIN